MRVALNLIFVVAFRMGVKGAVYTNVLATAIQASSMGAYAIAHVGFRFKWKRARVVFGFSWPILVGSLGSYYIGFADRYFLRMFSDLDVIGLYALAARFGAAYFAFGYAPFSMAWDAERYRIAKSADPVPAFQQIFRMLSAYLVFLALTISILADDVVRVLAAEPFWGAAGLVPIFVVNALFMAWGAFVRFGLLLKERTIEFARVTWMAVPITTVAFVLLIPPLGAAGGALAVAIGNLFRLVYVHHRATAAYDMQLEWSRVLPVAGVLVLAGVAIRFVAAFTTGTVAAVMDAGILIVGALLIWCVVLTADDRRRAMEVVRIVTARRPASGTRRA